MTNRRKKLLAAVIVVGAMAAFGLWSGGKKRGAWIEELNSTARGDGRTFKTDGKTLVVGGPCDKRYTEDFVPIAAEHGFSSVRCE